MDFAAILQALRAIEFAGVNILEIVSVSPRDDMSASLATLSVQ